MEDNIKAQVRKLNKCLNIVYKAKRIIKTNWTVLLLLSVERPSLLSIVSRTMRLPVGGTMSAGKNSLRHTVVFIHQLIPSMHWKQTPTKMVTTKMVLTTFLVFRMGIQRKKMETLQQLVLLLTVMKTAILGIQTRTPTQIPTADKRQVLRRTV